MAARTLRPIEHTYDSFAAYVDDALTRADRSYNGASNRPGDEWAGTPDLYTAHHLAVHGWNDVRPQVDALTAPIVDSLRDRIVPTVEWHAGYSGSAVRMDAYMQGNPRCVTVPYLTERPGTARIAHIMVSYTASAVVSAENILARGAAVTALVQLLGTANRSTVIDIRQVVRPSNSHSKQLHVTTVRIKEASEPLDIDRLAFALAHPSMLRRICFAHEEGEPDAVRKRFGFTAIGGYGMPQSLGAWTDDTPADVQLDTIQSSQSWTDPTYAVDWIKSQLTALGVTLTDD